MVLIREALKGGGFDKEKEVEIHTHANSDSSSSRWSVFTQTKADKIKLGRGVEIRKAEVTVG